MTARAKHLLCGVAGLVAGLALAAGLAFRWPSETETVLRVFRHPEITLINAGDEDMRDTIIMLGETAVTVGHVSCLASVTVALREPFAECSPRVLWTNSHGRRESDAGGYMEYSGMDHPTVVITPHDTAVTVDAGTP